MKLGIIIDSSSGWTKEEAKNKGWGYIPILITINGKTYKDGVDLDDHSFYSTIDVNDNVSTACASPAAFVDTYKEMSKNYDEVIYFPISEDLSSHSANAIVAAKSFKNIHIVKSKSAGYEIIYLLEQAEKLASKNIGAKELVNRLNIASKESQGMILPKSMDWLKKGGRVSRSTAMLGNMLSIIPIIYFDGRMEKWGKGRTLPKTILKACKGLDAILEGKDAEYEHVLLVGHEKNDPEYKKIDDKLRSILEKHLNKSLRILILPRLITIHVGIGAYAIITTPKKI